MRRLRALLRWSRPGRREMEALADPAIGDPEALAKMRDPKPMIRCENCKVETTLPVCVLCITKGYVAKADRVTGELAAFVAPYDQAQETQKLEAVEVEDGWRYPRAPTMAAYEQAAKEAVAKRLAEAGIPAHLIGRSGPTSGEAFRATQEIRRPLR